LAQEHFYICHQVHWVKGLIISPYWLAQMVHKELFKIPPDVVLVEGLIVEFVGSLKLSSDRRAPPFQKTVNRVLQLPVHVRFGKHLKVGLKVVAWPDMFQY